jgi:sensor histidine kinase YesM
MISFKVDMPKLELYIRWIGIPLLAYFIQFLNPDHYSQKPFWLEYFHSLVFTAVYWNGAYMIFMLYRKKFKDIRQTGIRLTLTIVSLILFIMMASPVLKLLMGYLTLDGFFDTTQIFNMLPVVITVSLLVGGIYEGAFFFHNWKKTIEQNEALKNQQIRTQFEVLQNQMSPHFLFNSLNTLTTLIAENQEIAINFTEKLSEVYRYILHHKDKELVLLRDELEFVKSYLFLLKMRYPDNLTESIRVEDHYQQQYIAPLTLQILVENAIKHNIISKGNPLKIEIYVDNGRSIIVKNNLQVKPVIPKSTKTGLENIRKRYHYLGYKDIDIITSHQNFMVAIPLVEVQQSYPELQLA